MYSTWFCTIQVKTDRSFVSLLVRLWHLCFLSLLFFCKILIIIQLIYEALICIFLFHLFGPVVYNKKRINIFYLSFTVKENEIRHCQSQCLILIYKSLFCFFVSDIAIINRLLNEYGYWVGACTLNIHGSINIIIV